LRTLWTTGAPSSPDAIRQLQALLPDCTIGSSYGMTEATGIANCQFDPTLPDELFQRRLHAAGLPMPLMAVRLLNGRGADVPTGEVGEVHVRGATMMSGYWEDPELTASTMTDGWFNTGDVGRFDEDGYLYLVDRSVDIINSGGLNIYSAEVERVLLGHPAVAEAAVVSAPHERWGEQVCAFIVTQPETAVTAEALISYCGAELGSFKKPGMVRFCPSLPRNEMGKVHKSELRGLNWVGTGATIGPRRNVDRSR
jgi:acyl-CoA synthetase (AMP-forming)/AMP-acid ligase II